MTVTRVHAYLEQQVKDAVDEACEDALCVACYALAVIVLVTEPCAHKHPLCGRHAESEPKRHDARAEHGIPSMCGLCHMEVLELRWEQP